MRDKKSKLSVDDKVHIVLQTLNPNTSIAELSKEYNLTPKTICTWRDQFLKGARSSFDGKGTASQTKNHEKEIAQLKRIIGEHAVVIHALKKVLDEK